MSERPTPWWLDRQAQLSLDRLLPTLRERYASQDPAGWPVFEGRLRTNFRRLFELLLHLYGERYDFVYHLENILSTAARLWLARPADLKALDGARETAPFCQRGRACFRRAARPCPRS